MSALQINRAIAAFAKSIGLEGFALNEEGFGVLTFDDRFHVAIARNDTPSELVFDTTLGTLPGHESDAMALLTRLLQANHLWQETGHGVLGLNAEKVVTFSMRIAGDGLDTTRFEAELKKFLDLAEYWQKQIRQADHADSPESASHSPVSPASGPHMRV